MSLVKLREPREQDLWVCLFSLSHRQEQQERKPTSLPGHSRFPSQRESLLGDDGCSEKDVRGFSSTPSFKLELTGNRKYNSMDAYKMAFRSAEAALPYPVVPVRLAQLLSDIEESTFLCCFPFSLKNLLHFYIFLPEVSSHLHFLIPYSSLLFSTIHCISSLSFHTDRLPPVFQLVESWT